MTSYDESRGRESNDNRDDDAILDLLIALSLSFDSSDSPNCSGIFE